MGYQKNKPRLEIRRRLCLSPACRHAFLLHFFPPEAEKQSVACEASKKGLRYTEGVLCRLVFTAMLLFFCFASPAKQGDKNKARLI
jgi:hypothetical protein